MNTRKFVNVVLVAACSIALASCDTGATPESQSSSASTNTPSASGEENSPAPDNGTAKYEPATPSSPAKNVPLPKMPDTAKRQSKAGASDFSEYYFEIINYSIETNDSQPLKKITTRSCQVCGESLIDPADAAKRAGSWQVGGKHSYKVLDSQMTSPDKAAVIISFKTQESTLYSKDGRTPYSDPETDSEIITLGVEFDDGWKVYRILFDGE